MRKLKHGIELRFSKGRKLKLLSYAVWTNGNCCVNHATTRATRRGGANLVNLVQIEKQNTKLPII